MYIKNIIPHVVVDEKTLEEVFTGEKPDISHLQIFVCPMYIHIPKEKRTKMEPSGKKGTFVGYNETSKKFRIYVVGERHVEASIDVNFHEEEAFKWSKEFECNVKVEEQHQSIDEQHQSLIVFIILIG